MLNTGFSPWPSYTSEEIKAVSDVLSSNQVNYWTGTQCREFEKEFAAWVGTEYAIALANGTLALDLALKALGVGPGDEVIVTPRSFIASVSCVVNAGATPVFVDVDPETQNIAIPSVEAAITPRTKAVVCVHLAGWPCDMDPLMALADKHGFFVVEDCAQAHGARYKGRPVGSIGHIGAWSFCQDKIMTTGGEGGMVTTDDKALWSAMWSYKDHGKSWEAVYERNHPPGFRWVHESFGTNWRMLEMQAVIGRVQLKRMPEWMAKRKANALRLAKVAARHAVARVPLPPEHVDHAWYRFYFFVRPDYLAPAWTRDRIIAEITSRGVPCMQGSCSEIYLEKAFDATPYRPAQRLPVAKALGETSVMMLVHPTLTESEMDKACSVLDDILARAST